ncbi:class I SAM-dependent methyltransferase [Actinomadura algeriensis]|uniref:SAM-dependent methyltransferase n=1 Tax=Actinomadura algeriensis TaxID=1679523 RepID=A0ABR9JRM8_9ACTN|nr:class I SAM-dependent methyltransferase [Actinomadura algeriensis]MBE1533143.1 SAM-dependent methyltransferase [Actinomadura algeriensis]
MTETATWQAWQDSWDRQQEWYMPDREERFRVMLDMVEALAGPEPAVLDLACGTGSITDRLLKRFPGARATGVDIDPALLTIARGHFAGNDRVELVTADLTDPGWTGALPHRAYDAVVTATALHWLDTEPLRVLYGQVRDVLRDGGVFLNADHMTDESAPRLNAAAQTLHAARQERARTAGALDWRDWWTEVAADPALAGPAERRFALLGDPRGPARPTPDRPTTTRWHLDALREQGFAEARQVWCSHCDALVAALR